MGLRIVFFLSFTLSLPKMYVRAQDRRMCTKWQVSAFVATYLDIGCKDDRRTIRRGLFDHQLGAEAWRSVEAGCVRESRVQRQDEQNVQIGSNSFKACKVVRVNGRLHSISGEPAVTVETGALIWCRHGQLHREEDLPAMIHEDGAKYWYYRGLLHRVHAPACIQADGTKYWYQRDQLHRGGGLPSVEWGASMCLEFGTSRFEGVSPLLSHFSS